MWGGLEIREKGFSIEGVEVHENKICIRGLELHEGLLLLGGPEAILVKQNLDSIFYAMGDRKDKYCCGISCYGDIINNMQAIKTFKNWLKEMEKSYPFLISWGKVAQLYIRR